MPLPDFVSEEVKAALGSSGIESLFPVQEQVFPHVRAAYEGRVRYDVCVCSPTGSGKTLAYTLPIVEALRGRCVPRLACVVVAPRKELAAQVFGSLRPLARAAGLAAQLASGDEALRADQARFAGQQPDVLVATPSRLLEMLHGTAGMTLAALRFLVLDESDLLLADATQDWLRAVLRKVDCDVRASGVLHPAPLHRLLFSATLTHNLAKLNQVQLVNAKHFMLAGDGSALKSVLRYAVPDTLAEQIGRCGEGAKVLALRRILADEPGTVLVFTKTTDEAHRLARLLQLMGADADEFSGQLLPAQRAAVVQRLRTGESTCGVCSDALARGIDVERVSLVVNYEVPTYIQAYIHRVGRTARAGRAGAAISLLETDEECEEFAALRGKAQRVSGGDDVPTVQLGHGESRRETKEALMGFLDTCVGQLQAVLAKERKGLLQPHAPLPEEIRAVVAKAHPQLVMRRKKNLSEQLARQQRRARDDDDDDDDAADGIDEGSAGDEAAGSGASAEDAAEE